MDQPRARVKRSKAGVAPDPLQRYAAKRNFAVTPEPKAQRAQPAEALGFVIQKHWATRLHYDFRLELDGVLLSWAVPKGPSFDPAEKRMAVHVEDHPVSYGSFEGTIPPRQYGAGTVIVWDRGTWEPVGDPREGMAKGKLVFRLHGEKLAGLWELVRIAKPGDRQDPWMLFKKRDEWARPLAEYDVIAALPDSVVEKPLGLLEQRQPRSAVTAAGSAVQSAAQLPGAVKAALPAALSPQLATPAQAPPTQGEWIYELKLDGYRLLARIDERGRARLITRNGHDWTAKMKPLAEAVEALGVRSAWLDGEIVVLDDKGTPNFNLLQNAFDAARTEAIRYFLFDLPFADGHDLRRVPLHARRALLKQRLDGHDSDHLRLSADFPVDPASLLHSVAQLGLEGIIAKRADAPYVSDRTNTWLKLKTSERQEFVVGGFSDRAGSTGEVGSLLLGYYDDAGVLRYAGNVGTGWNASAAAELHKKLVDLETKASPFEPGSVQPGRWSRLTLGRERWVRPSVVVEVRFAGWTPDGSVRHAVFMGVRTDKPPRTVRRERDSAVQVAAVSPNRVGSVKVSNPERIIDPSSGLKKLDLVRYYESVAEWMLPHLKARPVALVRGPTGIAGELFFQKHDDKLSISGLRELDPSYWPGHPPMLEVPTAEALVSAAQMNVIEFHTWNSTTRRIDKPDRIVFDLDPGEGVSWSRVQEAAVLTRTLLDELGLKAWLKTSGGKGLHVVVPIAARLDYDTVKAFSQAVVQHLAQTVPSRFVAKSGASNRVGKVFVDYLRNTLGATTAAAFSARARPGLGVSMPVAWEQLSALKSGAQWSIATAREYLSFQKSDPWADYWKARQTLTKAMKTLQR
ncbi:DNA ligase D [Piscinibacter sp. XHJ-5]|uniref:DNA ligase D n=1 Tax=Piscinibacter sp. XHJ-5 TaxID=3037797 RepID=UPI00245290D2|nr:DNA ligase D [Piscinibacter sp. XHJ-5]